MQIQEKHANTRAYLFVFIFRNAKLRRVVTYMFHLDTTPLWHNFLERKKMSKRRNLGSVCREGSGNARSSVLWAISLLNYAWNDLRLSEVENRRKKWLTFDTEVDEYAVRFILYFISEWKRIKFLCLLIIFEIFEFCLKPDDAKKCF